MNNFQIYSNQSLIEILGKKSELIDSLADNHPKEANTQIKECNEIIKELHLRFRN